MKVKKRSLKEKGVMKKKKKIEKRFKKKKSPQRTKRWLFWSGETSTVVSYKKSKRKKKLKEKNIYFLSVVWSTIIFWSTIYFII